MKAKWKKFGWKVGCVAAVSVTLSLATDAFVKWQGTETTIGDASADLIWLVIAGIFGMATVEHARLYLNRRFAESAGDADA